MNLQTEKLHYVLENLTESTLPQNIAYEMNEHQE